MGWPSKFDSPPGKRMPDLIETQDEQAMRLSQIAQNTASLGGRLSLARQTLDPLLLLAQPVSASLDLLAEAESPFNIGSQVRKADHGGHHRSLAAPPEESPDRHCRENQSIRQRQRGSLLRRQRWRCGIDY